MDPIAIWIWFCAYLNCAELGIISAIHQLNAAGYSVALFWFCVPAGLAEKKSRQFPQTSDGKSSTAAFAARFRLRF